MRVRPLSSLIVICTVDCKMRTARLMAHRVIPPYIMDIHSMNTEVNDETGYLYPRGSRAVLHGRAGER